MCIWSSRGKTIRFHCHQKGDRVRLLEDQGHSRLSSYQKQEVHDELPRKIELHQQFHSPINSNLWTDFQVIEERCRYEDYQKAFDKITEYLLSPPVLVPSEPGKPLLLYLSVLDNAFGCVLGQHNETRKREQAIYYMSKKLTPYEARYTLFERTCCALTWIAQTLRRYLSAYTTYLISRFDPLKYIF